MILINRIIKIILIVISISESHPQCTCGSCVGSNPCEFISCDQCPTCCSWYIPDICTGPASCGGSGCHGSFITDKFSEWIDKNLQLGFQMKLNLTLCRTWISPEGIPTLVPGTIVDDDYCLTCDINKCWSNSSYEVYVSINDPVIENITPNSQMVFGGVYYDYGSSVSNCPYNIASYKVATAKVFMDSKDSKPVAYACCDNQEAKGHDPLPVLVISQECPNFNTDVDYSCDSVSLSNKPPSDCTKAYIVARPIKENSSNLPCYNHQAIMFDGPNPFVIGYYCIGPECTYKTAWEGRGGLCNEDPHHFHPITQQDLCPLTEPVEMIGWSLPCDKMYDLSLKVQENFNTCKYPNSPIYKFLEHSCHDYVEQIFKLRDTF